MGKEIERKWLMNGFPELVELDRFDIVQGYLNINPEVRIRRKVRPANYRKSPMMNHRLCIKGEGDLTRTEVEKDLTKFEFYDLEELVDGSLINKDYRQYNYEGYTLEVSCVDFGVFYYAEIEFESEDQASVFVVPNWFGKEVTYDKSYKMKNYFVSKNSKVIKEI